MRRGRPPTLVSRGHRTRRILRRSRQLFKPGAQFRQVVSTAACLAHRDLESVSPHLVGKRLAAHSAPCVSGEIGHESVGPVQPLREEVPRRLAPDIFARTVDIDEIPLASAEDGVVESLQGDGWQGCAREFRRAVFRARQGIGHAVNAAIGERLYELGIEVLANAHKLELPVEAFLRHVPEESVELAPSRFSGQAKRDHYTLCCVLHGV